MTLRWPGSRRQTVRLQQLQFPQVHAAAFWMMVVGSLFPISLRPWSPGSGRTVCWSERAKPSLRLVAPTQLSCGEFDRLVSRFLSRLRGRSVRRRFRCFTPGCARTATGCSRGRTTGHTTSLSTRAPREELDDAGLLALPAQRQKLLRRVIDTDGSGNAPLNYAGVRRVQAWGGVSRILHPAKHLRGRVRPSAWEMAEPDAGQRSVSGDVNAADPVVPATRHRRGPRARCRRSGIETARRPHVVEACVARSDLVRGSHIAESHQA